MENKSEVNVVLSVIVPAYNAEQTIASCIESLLSQTYKAKEIIVVDDGSKDNTYSILLKLAQLNDSIRIIHQDNGGVSSARNTALSNVSQEITHICFVDADDVVRPNFLKHFAENIEKGKFVIQGLIKQYKNETIQILYNTKENLLKQLIKQGDLGHLFNKCFDLNIIRQYRLHFNERFTFAEDEAFVLDYMQYIPDLKYVNVAQYKYYIPLIERAYLKDNNMEMYFYCLSKMNNICKKLNISLREVYSSRLFRCGKQFFKPSNFKRNKEAEIKYYFKVYISETKSIPLFFSIWHFAIIFMFKIKIENLYIRLLSNVYNILK